MPLAQSGFHQDPAAGVSGGAVGSSGKQMQVQEMVMTASSKVMQMQYRREFSREYTTNEDFSRMFPGYKRLVVVGCTGAGKSALINKLAGSRMEYNEQQSEYAWNTDNLVFTTSSSTTSVTKFTSFANVHYLGYAPELPLIVVDTPGHDDTDPDMLTEQATDLNVKLQQMGFVNAVLVLHKDFESNRLDPATFELLKKMSTIFKAAGKDFWKHVIMGYTRVDEEKRGWKSRLDEKILNMQMALKTETQKREFECPCMIDVPIICLSCYEDAPDAQRPFGDFPFPDLKAHGSAKRIAQAEGFVGLWDFVQAAGQLRCEDLAVYEGIEERFRKACIARDQNARIAAARKHFMSTAMNCLVITAVLILRPGILNYSGLADELLLVGAFVYISGLYQVWDFLRVFWDDYAIPKLEASGIGSRLPLNKARLLGETS